MLILLFCLKDVSVCEYSLHKKQLFMINSALHEHVTKLPFFECVIYWVCDILAFKSCDLSPNKLTHTYTWSKYQHDPLVYIVLIPFGGKLLLNTLLVPITILALMVGVVMVGVSLPHQLPPDPSQWSVWSVIFKLLCNIKPHVAFMVKT